MGATANNNAVINCQLFYEVLMFVKQETRNNLMILRNLTQKYVAEFVVCCALVSARPSASRHQCDRFSNRSIV